MPKRSSNVARRSFKRKRTSTTKRKPTKRVKRFTRKRSATKRSLVSKPRKVGTSAWISYGGTMPKKRNPTLRKMQRMLADKITVNNSGQQGPLTIGKQDTLTLSEEYTQGDILSPDNEKRILRSCCTRSILTNNTNTTIFLTLYDYVCRRDSNVAKTAVDYWKDNPASGAATTDPAVIGTTPFNAHSFTIFHKILKTTKIYLGAGESIEHIKYIQPNKLYDGSIEIYNASANQRFKGLTHGTIAAYHGQPAGDSADTDVTTAGTTTDALFIVTTKTLKHAVVEDNLTTFTATGGIVTSFTGHGEIMETDGDAGLSFAVGA